MDFQEFKAAYQHKEVMEYPNKVGDNPVVSVCVQTYQHAAYIKKCLDGILMQKTDFPIEILLGEDASTDGTREICIDYAQKYPEKIKLLLHHRENNILISDTPTGRFIFVCNLFLARGKYIALCEGDDFWNDPYKLQKQVGFLEQNTDYVITYHDAEIIDEVGNLIKKSKLKEKGKRDFTSSELKKGVNVLTLSMCFRNLINEYPKEFPEVLNGDTFLTSLLGSHGKGKYMKNIFPASYRIHEGGIWSLISEEKYFRSRIQTYSSLRNYYGRTKDNESTLFYQRNLRNAHIGFMEYLLSSAQFKLFFKQFKLSIKENREGKVNLIRDMGISLIKGSLAKIKKIE